MPRGLSRTRSAIQTPSPVVTHDSSDKTMTVA
jgi:hypothetical protein